jgi:hypothetical protein
MAGALARVRFAIHAVSIKTVISVSQCLGAEALASEAP